MIKNRHRVCRLRTDKQSRALLILFVILGVSSPSGFAQPNSVQKASTPSDLAGAITELLKERVHAHHPEADIEVALPTQLPPMDRPCHQAELSVTHRLMVGRIPVRVRCKGDHPWSFYASSQVQAFKPVVTAKHPIARGQSLTKGHLVIARQPINTQNPYFTQIAPLVGMVSKRQIGQNQAIGANYVAQPIAVQRGDEVMIRASLGNVVISTVGTALESGHIGQQISVKNRASKKVIRSWIKARGLVATRALGP